MGADKKSMLRKCGDILMNIKANKKSKVYVFKCAFCNTNCNQLKKFSLHLDENHSKQISEETLETSVAEDETKYDVLNQNVDIKHNLEVFEPEIKVEDLMEIGATPPEGEDDESKSLVITKGESIYDDPLAMKEATVKRPMAKEIHLKSEQIENESDDECRGDTDINAYDFHCNEMDYEDSVDGTESEGNDSNHKEGFTGQKSKRLKWKPKKVVSSDVSSDDSKDCDFDINKEEAKVKRLYVKKTKQAVVKVDNLNLDEKELIIAILEAFEKQSILWAVKDRSHDRALRQNGFQAIAQEVNEKFQIQMKWEDVRNRIKDIRDEYSREYEKQGNGEKYEMPWYTEHMMFLEENIKCLIKHRKKKNRRLKTLDESHISLYIEYYKNCEILWQINNIGFVLKPKKVEALKFILEDIKVKHNIYINIHDLESSLDYINRIYSTDKEKQLKCEVDKSEFVPSSKFYNELSFLSESQGPFKCSHCNEIIYNFETYHEHVAGHTNSVPFKCALCEMRFTKLRTYIVHAKRHLGINSFHCDFCGKGYPVRGELDWHVREHTGEEPYLCEICGSSFRSRHGYDNHIRRHENRFRYECHICKHGFNHLHSLKAHVKAHLNIRDILCNVCGKGFTANQHLLRHQQIHSDTKRYKCDVCGKAFAQDAGLRAHRKQHVQYTSLEEKTKKRKRKQIATEEARVNRVNVKKTKKRDIKEKDLNIDEKDIIKEILRAFEKQSSLWAIKDRSRDRAIRQNSFQSIAQEVNEKFQIQIKWEDVRKRIKDIRDEYSREYEKQMNGQKYEMPWYTEHVTFLEENIKCLIKLRKRKNRRLKTLDECHTSMCIEYYKNCEILWRINHIGFVLKPKKIEALKLIVEDIKVKHNIDLNIRDMQRRLDYINRVYSTDKKRQLKCEVDKTEFVPSSKFYGELSFLSESQGPFKCSHCNEIIYNFETYHEHVAGHTNSVPFKCALCEMRFTKLRTYIVHAKRHLGIRNYHCVVCGKAYPVKGELDRHVREHTGEEPYLCEICGAGFRSRPGYNNHKRRHEDHFRFECHICKHGFNQLHSLKAHVKAHLNIRDILCNVCGKGFTANQHLLRHQQIHSGTKRYKCGVCGKAFAQDAGLRAHRKQHIEYTPLEEKAQKSKYRKEIRKND